MQKGSSQITLGYWATRGTGEPCRLLLEYTGLKYNQKKYTSFDAWMADKFTLGFDFPNLPYIIDGDEKITETDAIHHYICIKSGHKDLLGKSDKEVINLAMVKGVLTDAKTPVNQAMYNPDYSRIIGDILQKQVIPKIEYLEKFSAKKGGIGLIGTQITYIDFIFYEYSQLLLTMNDKFFDKFPTLKKIIQTIQEHPRIQAYLKSDRFVPRPFNAAMAAYNPK